MKRLLCAVATAILAACASPAPPPSSPAVAEFVSWSKDTRARVEAGQVKYSDFYKEGYDRYATLPIDYQGKLIIMQMYAELIPLARQYESGALTKEQFDDARRLRRMAAVQKGEALAENRRQIRADVLRDLANSIQPPVQTDCIRGPAGSTSCITR